MTRLALAALVSWAHTFRFLVVAVVLLVVFAVVVLIAVWLLPIEVSFGPVQITRHDHTSNS